MKIKVRKILAATAFAAATLVGGMAGNACMCPACTGRTTDIEQQCKRQSRKKKTAKKKEAPKA